MAVTDQVQWQNPLFPLLTSVLGGQSSTEGTTSTSGTSSGTTSQAGTSQQSTTGTTGQTGSTTSNQTSTGTSTQTTTADVAALREILGKQMAGISPEMLSAIFEEGAKKVPGLTTAYANAVGARASDNSPLALSIRDLQGDLTNQAAQLNLQLLKDSGFTAQALADLTKTVTDQTTGTTAGTGTSATTGTSSSNTTGTSSTTGANNQTNSSTTNQDIDQSNTVNTDALKVLAGLGLGTSALDWALGGNSGGGLGGLLSLITGVGGNSQQGSTAGGLGGLIGQAGNWLSNLINPQTSAAWTGLFGSPISTSLQDFDIGLGGNFFPELGFNFDAGAALDSLDDYVDFLDFGWADGGEVSTQAAQPTSSDQNKQRQQWMQTILSNPIGRRLLLAKAQADKQKFEKYSWQDWNTARRDYLQQNKIPDAAMDFQTMFGKYLVDDGADTGQFGGAVKTWEDSERAWRSSLPPAAQQLYLNSMRESQQGNVFEQVMDRVAPMIPGAVLGLGAAGATGLLSPGVAGAAGFGAGGASSTAGPIGNMILRQLLSQGIKAGTGAVGLTPGGRADGGRIEPKVGTKGPERKGSGAGGLSKESVLEAMQREEEEKKTKSFFPMLPRGDGVTINTKRALKAAGEYAEGGNVEGTALDMMKDPEGIEDTVPARLSVGEYVIPKDVVDKLGVDFFDYLKEQYHTPADMQRAMGVGGVSQ